MSTQFTRRKIVSSIAGIGLGATLPLAARAQAKTVVLGLIVPVAEYYPIYVGNKKGMFQAEGITLDIVGTDSSSKSVQMGSSDAINIGSSSWIDSVRAIASSAPLVIVANSLAVSPMMLIGAKDIKSVQQLKGKRVSVAGPKDVTMAWWTALAKKSGMHPTNDVEVIFGGGTPSRFAALVSGGVQAACVGTPLAFNAIEQGYTKLAVFGPLLPNIPYMAWHANKAWAAANPATVKGFVRAHSKAIDYLYDPKNRQEVISILAESTKTSVKDCTSTHDLLVEIKGFTAGSKFAMSDVSAVLNLLTEFGDIKTPVSPEAVASLNYLG
jgi:NitT/TauT family transport system substrate-binding protein